MNPRLTLATRPLVLAIVALAIVAAYIVLSLVHYRSGGVAVRYHGDLLHQLAVRYRNVRYHG